MAEEAAIKIEYKVQGEPNDRVVVVLNGGHTNSTTPFVAQQYLTDNGFRLIIPSRPGYGGTPVVAGRTTGEFAKNLIGLLDELGITSFSILAISAAGPTALEMCRQFPKRVERMVLVSAVTNDNWLNWLTRNGAPLVFNRWSQRVVWALVRGAARKMPDALLKGFLPTFSTLKAKTVFNSLTPAERQEFVDYLKILRSDSGFVLDIKHHSGDLRRITTPTLLIHSRHDASVRFELAEQAARTMPNAKLVEAVAPYHLFWISSQKSELEQIIGKFLKEG